jgi:hypothetical protein
VDFAKCESSFFLPCLPNRSPKHKKSWFLFDLRRFPLSPSS